MNDLAGLSAVRGQRDSERALWADTIVQSIPRGASGVMTEAQKNPLPPTAELQWWYQYYFSTERGRAGYEKYRHDFAKLIWSIASPKWNFDDATFDRTAAAYRNKFSGKYAHREITGNIGHNLPQEAPQAFAQAIVDVDGFSPTRWLP